MTVIVYLLQPALLAFALLVEESAAAVGAKLGGLFMIAGVILASVVAPTLTVGLATSGTFQMIVSVDDENAEG